MNSKIIGIIPRSELVQRSEIEAKTVIEKYPESEQANHYRELAETIYHNQEFTIPQPMEVDEFEEFMLSNVDV